MTIQLDLILGPKAALERMKPVLVALNEIALDCGLEVHEHQAGGSQCTGHLLWLHDEDLRPTAAEVEWLDDVVGMPGLEVVPLVASAVAAGSLPPAFKPYNALLGERFGTAWGPAVADEIAGRLWLRRRRRRAFISYRRDDCQSIAEQLHSSLVAQRWDVFVDDKEIKWGGEFQRELMWELNDADVVILLASPRFAHSSGVMQEIAVAGKRGIGLVALSFPEAYYGSAGAYGDGPSLVRSRLVDNLAPRHDLRLALDQIEGSCATPSLQRLSKAALECVHAAVYRERTVALIDRAMNESANAWRALRRAAGAIDRVRGVHPSDFSCTVERDGTGPQAAFCRVLPFRPGPEELYDLASASPSGVTVTYCLYPENDPEHPRSVGLRWLMRASRGQPPMDFRLGSVQGHSLWE